jgi:hypothetical protein
MELQALKFYSANSVSTQELRQIFWALKVTLLYYYLCWNPRLCYRVHCYVLHNSSTTNHLSTSLSPISPLYSNSASTHVGTARESISCLYAHRHIGTRTCSQLLSSRHVWRSLLWCVLSRHNNWGEGGGLWDESHTESLKKEYTCNYGNQTH